MKQAPRQGYEELRQAWNWRESRGTLTRLECVRVFYGPGEASGALAAWAIDRFGDAYWVTEWETSREGGSSNSVASVLDSIREFLLEKGARTAVVLRRPQKGVPSEPEALLGEIPERFQADEEGAKFWIQLNRVRHPGLFLDHLPLRRWLRENARGMRVLNAFAYTGSLSIAAGLAGAEHVTTLDLSKPTIRWAQENWTLNHLPTERARWIAGDVFEWLPRLRRENQSYQAVILDPPSFSRGEKGSFSTAKDLSRLHQLAMALVEPGGLLITSINSANVSWAQYEKDVRAAATELRQQYQVVSRIDLPDTFPTRWGPGDSRYLKGWILRRTDQNFR